MPDYSEVKPNNVQTEPNNQVTPEKTKSKRRRQRRKAKKEITNENGSNSDSKLAAENLANKNDSLSKRKNERSKQKKKRSRRKPDRYYGSFRCKVCRKSWDSAFVFTRAGTKKVLFKQRCKHCSGEEAWVFPYRLEFLRCSFCQSDICECKCEVCDRLIHKRYYYENKESRGNDFEERIIDDSFEYCECEGDRRKDAWIGGNIDLKKPHLSQFCEKCQKGYPCTGRRTQNDELGQDNEP